MPVTPIKSRSQFQSVINSGRVVIIDFWAEWCGPCKMISPVLEDLSDDANHREVEFYKVDVDEQSEIAQEVGIRAMPTFIVFKGGEKVGELIGAKANDLRALVTQASLG